MGAEAVRQSQVETLRVLGEHDGVSAYRLANLLGITYSKALDRLKRLEKKGFVERNEWTGRWYRV